MNESKNINRVVVSLGSNINPYANFANALRIIKSQFVLKAVSSFQGTKPIGITDQPDFLNGAVLIETPYDLDNVRMMLKAIEDEMGRDRTVPKYGPRIIDLDVVIWNDDVVDSDYYIRDFLRKAIAELNCEE